MTKTLLLARTLLAALALTLASPAFGADYLDFRLEGPAARSAEQDGNAAGYDDVGDLDRRMVEAGDRLRMRVTLARQQSASQDPVVTLTSSNSEVFPLPSGVKFRGSTLTDSSYMFYVYANPVMTRTQVTLTASHASLNKQITLTILPVRPLPNAGQTHKVIVRMVDGAEGLIPVRLSCPAPAGGLVVRLTAAGNACTFPATVQFAAGESERKIAVTAHAHDQPSSQAVLSAELAGQPATRVEVATVVAFRHNRALPFGGAGPMAPGRRELRVSLFAYHDRDQTVTLEASGPDADLVDIPQPTATVAAGQLNAVFPIDLRPVTAKKSLPFRVRVDEAPAQFHSIEVEPATFAGLDLAYGVGPAAGRFHRRESVPVGVPLVGRLRMTGATKNAIEFTLVSEDTELAAVPARVTIAAGADHVDFPITANPTRTGRAKVRAQGGDVVRDLGWEVVRQGLQSTMIPFTAVPSSVGGGDIAYVQAAVIGVAPPGGFRVDVRSNNTAVEGRVAVIPEGEQELLIPLKTKPVDAVVPQVAITGGGLQTFLRLTPKSTFESPQVTIELDRGTVASGGSIAARAVRSQYGPMNWPIEVELRSDSTGLLTFAATPKAAETPLTPQMEWLLANRTRKPLPGRGGTSASRRRQPGEQELTLVLRDLGAERTFELRAARTLPTFAGAIVGISAETFVERNTSAPRRQYLITIPGLALSVTDPRLDKLSSVVRSIDVDPADQSGRPDLAEEDPIRPELPPKPRREPRPGGQPRPLPR